MLQNLKKVLAHILNERITLILLICNHIAKRIVKLHQTLIFELV
jgi:hypothetical protein